MDPTSGIRWSRWEGLGPGLALTPRALAETLDGGQAFRWNSVSPGVFRGIWLDRVAEVRVRPASRESSNGSREDATEPVEWRAPTSEKARTGVALSHYLRAGTDFDALTDSLPWRSDAALAEAIARWRGLRILRQPLSETLLGFICSSTKRIVQIKAICATLAERFGEPLPGAPEARALPSWDRLASIPEADLRACKLGYRARHIAGTAAHLAAHPGFLATVETLPFADARAALTSLPGVGEKIADCVLLFGANRLEAFPVDAWILKAMARQYGLENWTPPHVAHFGRVHFGPLAGLAQQYLFSRERKGSD